MTNSKDWSRIQIGTQQQLSGATANDWSGINPHQWDTGSFFFLFFSFFFFFFFGGLLLFLCFILLAFDKNEWSVLSMVIQHWIYGNGPVRNPLQLFHGYLFLLVDKDFLYALAGMRKELKRDLFHCFTTDHCLYNLICNILHIKDALTIESRDINTFVLFCCFFGWILYIYLFLFFH